jgi:hypothetical protein
VPAVLPADVAATDWAAAWQEALEWVTAYPGNEQEAIARFERIAQGAVGTPYAGMATARADALRLEFNRRVDGVMSELDRQARPLLAAGNFQEAARIYREYDGNLFEQTKDARAARVQDCERRFPVANPTVTSPVAPIAATGMDLESLLRTVTDHVLGGEMEAAREALEAGIQSASLSDKADELGGALTEITGVEKAQRALLDSFAGQKGKSVDVELMSGKRMLLIKDVKDGRIVAEVVPAEPDTLMHGSMIEFEPALLSYRERLRRMGAAAGRGQNLLCGLLAREARADDSARRYFALVSPLLGPRLAESVGKESQPTP